MYRTFSPPDDLTDRHGMKSRLVAKRMIDMFVRDEDLQKLIDTVVEVNKTNHAGDGKIFVLPVNDAIRVRTGEKGIEAIM